MNKSIIVGLVALGLAACGGAVEDQPTDAVTAEAPAVEVVEDVASEEVSADAQVVVGEPSSSDPAKEPTVVYPAEEVQ